ncbi:MAG: IS110 family transposase [Clostridiales bacterium]|nr:IS110 family transposase [Clostridiales bacterium]
MSVFPTSKHLCSWAGLTPQNNESAGKKKTTRISVEGISPTVRMGIVIPYCS